MLHFPAHQTLVLKEPSQLAAFLAAEGEANRGIVAVRFERDFDIKSEHVKSLVEAIGGSLDSLTLGSSDTGDGVWLTDAGVLAIVKHCPNLRQLALCSCTNVSDKAFIAVLEGLPHLEVLHCTGHDRSSGAQRRWLDRRATAAARRECQLVRALARNSLGKSVADATGCA